jgi:hypothetical protein
MKSLIFNNTSNSGSSNNSTHTQFGVDRINLFCQPEIILCKEIHVIFT